MSTTNARANAESFKATIEAKIQDIVKEFAEGQISREQFQLLYERYSSRLAIANEALMTNNPDAVEIAQGGPPTIAVRSASMGKALGMMIHHNSSSLTVETLGEFNVPVVKISPTLNEFSMYMEVDQLVEPRSEQLGDRQWLLFTPGKYTTVITLFRNQPSQAQILEIRRLHHDFENANADALKKNTFQAKKLAYPFMVFIQQKFRGK
jgi:hypothetical protein